RRISAERQRMASEERVQQEPLDVDLGSTVPDTAKPEDDARPALNGNAILTFRDVDTFYGQIQVLRGVNYTVNEGEIVALLGGNGAGKTTTMKTILGIVRPRNGTVEFRGKRIDNLPTPKIV